MIGYADKMLFTEQLFFDILIHYIYEYCSYQLIFECPSFIFAVIDFILHYEAVLNVILEILCVWGMGFVHNSECWAFAELVGFYKGLVLWNFLFSVQDNMFEFVYACVWCQFISCCKLDGWFLFMFLYWVGHHVQLYLSIVLFCSLIRSDYLFKLLLIGDSGVGKSCLLLRFAVSARCLFVLIYC